MSNRRFQSSVDYESLGKRLRAYRIGASLQAEQVAEKLGVSRAVIYRIEKGQIVKIDMLERLADLLGTSMASLLGVEVEYYSNALGLFERMRQIEMESDHVFAHFEPISMLLTSDNYIPYLRMMLDESSPSGDKGSPKAADIDQIIDVLLDRRAKFQNGPTHILSIIGLRELERLLQSGLVGRMDLPAPVVAERRLAARVEILHIAGLMENEPLTCQIGLIDDVMPASTFQIFRGSGHKTLVTSPFRLGELPNVHNGIATVTQSPEAVRMYENLMSRLWARAYKGRAAADKLHELLDRFKLD